MYLQDVVDEILAGAAEAGMHPQLVDRLEFDETMYTDDTKNYLTVTAKSEYYRTVDIVELRITLRNSELTVADVWFRHDEIGALIDHTVALDVVEVNVSPMPSLANLAGAAIAAHFADVEIEEIDLDPDL